MGKRLLKGREFIICARTDARGVIGMDEALNRAKRVRFS